jgi:hypothetical protein
VWSQLDVFHLYRYPTVAIVGKESLVFLSTRKELVDLGIFVTLLALSSHRPSLPKPFRPENGPPIKKSNPPFKMNFRVPSETEGDSRNSNRHVFYRQIAVEEELGVNAS